MNVFMMVVLIVLITMGGKVLQARYRAIGRLADQPPIRNADAVAAEAELRQLKDRVAVLERVVTDNHGSLDLEREIERLRDR